MFLPFALQLFGQAFVLHLPKLTNANNILGVANNVLVKILDPPLKENHIYNRLFYIKLEHNCPF